MNTKLLFVVLALAFCFSNTIMAQNKEQAKKEKSITWYGVDFTKAKFTLVTEDPTIIVNQYLKSINQLIVAEPEKFDIKKFFNKTETALDLEQVNARNSAITPDGLVITDVHTLALDDVKGVVSQYNTKGKPGLGLLFVAENLNKVQQTGSYYVVFFNQETKEIVDAERFEVKAVGIGFRNYWAGSVYNIMKIWLKSK